MANNFAQKTVNTPSTHGQGLYQMQSPGSHLKKQQFASPTGAERNMATVPIKNFIMSKQNSQVRQDDAIEMKPKTTFRSPQLQQSHVTDLRSGGAYGRSYQLAAELAQASDYYNQKKTRAEHPDYTNEEQFDEFEICDPEEIFDECDEQTGMQRHQMNMGLSRHPAKNSIPSEVFNIFNRGGSGVQEIVTAGNPRHTQNSNETNQAARDKLDYNDFLRNQSSQQEIRGREISMSPPPLAHFQKEAFFGSSFAAVAQRPSQLNKGNSVQPNTLALARVSRGRPTLNQHSIISQIAGSAQDQGPQNFKHVEIGALKMPDFFIADLSSRECATQSNLLFSNSPKKSDAQSPLQRSGTTKKASTAIPSRQHGDDQASEARQTAVIKHDARESDASLCARVPPVIFAAARHEQTCKASEQQRFANANHSNQLCPRLYSASGVTDQRDPGQQQQKSQISGAPKLSHNFDEEEETTFNLSHSAVQQASSQKVQGAASPNNVINTVQDTIFDQDDEVAEECAPMEQQDRSQQLQTTEMHDGPIYRCKLNRREEDVWDETADEDEELRSGSMLHQQQIQSIWAGPRLKMTQQASSPNAKAYQLVKNRQPSVPNLGESSSHSNSALRPSKSNASFQGSGPQLNKPKPLAAMVVPKHQQQTSSRQFSNDKRKQLANQSSSSRQSRANGQPNPSIADPRPSKRNKSDNVCETVEDIQESTVVMLNRNAFQSVHSDKKDSPVIKQQPQVGTATFDKYAVEVTVSEQTFNHVTMSKRDNKDQRIPGDITISELHSNEQKPIGNENQGFSECTGQNRHKEQQNNIRNDAYRSPLDTPDRFLPGETSRFSQAVEQRAVKDFSLANQPIVRKTMAQRDPAAFRSAIQSRQTINFEQTDANQPHKAANLDQSTASLIYREDPLTAIVQKPGVSGSKNLEQLQREYLELQKLQQSLLASQQQHSVPHQLNQSVFSHNNRPITDEFTAQKAFPTNQKQNNSMVYSQVGTGASRSKQKQINSASDVTKDQVKKERRQSLRNASSARLTPKTSKTNQQSVQIGSSGVNDGTVSEHHRQLNPTNALFGNARHVRMSARPYGERSKLENRQLSLSPNEHEMRVAKRRSPMPLQSKAIANEVCADTMSAKNFSYAQSDPAWLHQVQKNATKAGHPQNRSMISNNERQNADNDSGTQSMFMPGKTGRDVSKLQALAELRQRENNTVQMGQQLNLGRQRSREGYLQSMRKRSGLSRSTHDNCDAPPATDRPSRRKPIESVRPAASHDDCSIEAHRLPLINHQTENHENRALDLVAHTYKQSLQVADHKNLDSLERGLTAGDDDDGAADENLVVDVLSRSASADDDNQLEGSDDDELIEGDDYYDSEVDVQDEQEQLSDAESYEEEEDDYATEDEDGDNNQSYSGSEDCDSYNVRAIHGVGNHPSAQVQKMPPHRLQRSSVAKIGQSAATKKRSDSRGRANRGGARHPSQKSPYSERKSYNNRRPQQQSRKTNVDQRQRERHSKGQVPAKKHRVLNVGSRSTQDIQMDSNMKAQFSVSHAARKRNQPLKININMTGGSNGGQQMRQDTTQSMNSMQGLYPPQQHLAVLQPGYMYTAPNQQPVRVQAPLPLYYQPQAQVDPALQLQQFLLQQQQQMLNQLNNPQNKVLYSQFTGQPLLSQPPLQPQMVLNPQQTQQTTVSASQNQASVPAQAIYNPAEPSKASTVTEGNRSAKVWRGSETAQTTSLHRHDANDTDQISWLQSSVRSPQIEKTKTKMHFSEQSSDSTQMKKEEERKDVQEEEDEMEAIWAKLRQQDFAKKNTNVVSPQQNKVAGGQRNEAVSGQRKMKPWLDGDSKTSKMTKEPESDAVHAEQEEENFVVSKKQKRGGEAIIIGFDTGAKAIATDPWAKKPKLGAKRQPQQNQAELRPQVGRDGANKQTEEQEVVLPLGADFKKVPLEKIKEREDRLKKIKDSGLIEIALDEHLNGTEDLSARQVNLAEAFAAKRRVKLGDALPLDQDLAVARDTSATPRIPAKVEKAQKTPQELAAIRKAMMRKKPSAVIETESKQPLLSSVVAALTVGTSGVDSQARPSISSQRPGTAKEPSQALMERLAGGKRTNILYRVQIDKKEMKKLTKINYENLPEIKRRKEDERKRQEAQEKKERIAKYNKECKARSRAQLKKKREQAAAVVAIQGQDQTVQTQASLVSETEKK